MNCNNIIENDCQHSMVDHCFEYQYCSESSLVSRVAVTAFHILTLGIPLIIYLIHAHFKRAAESESFNASLATLSAFAISTSKDQGKLPISDFGKKMVVTACNLLKTSDIKPFIFRNRWSGDFFQPQNPLIPKLYSLYLELINKNIDENTDIASDLREQIMSVAFTLGYLTLCDFPDSVSQTQSCCPAELLANQTAYPYRTLSLILTYYHSLRRGAGTKSWDFGKNTKLDSSPEIPFFKDGTQENDFRNLYNEYCQLLHEVIQTKKFTNTIDFDSITRINSNSYYKSAYNPSANPQESFRLDARILMWALEDSPNGDFYAVPDTLPT